MKTLIFAAIQKYDMKTNIFILMGVYTATPHLNIFLQPLLKN
jgi:hypothetical protein